MNKEFFREEAVEYFNGVEYPAAFSVKPLSSNIILIGLYTVVAILLLASFLFSYSKKSHAHGVLESKEGLTRVFPRSSGYIRAMYVARGMEVKKGQKLFTVGLGHHSNLDGNNIVSKKESLLKKKNELSLQIKIIKEKQTANEALIKGKISNQRMSLKNLQEEINLKEKTKEIVMRQLHSAESLLGKGLLSQTSFEDSKLNALNVDASLAELNRDINVTRAAIFGLESDLSILPSETGLSVSNLKYQLQLLVDQEIELNAIEEYDILAPTDGIIFDHQGHIGMALSPNISLATLIPINSIIVAKLYIPAEDIGFIEVGDSALLSFSAFPKRNYGSFKARLTDIGQSLYKISELSTSLQLEEQPYYLAEASLDSRSILIGGASMDLQPDMEFDAVLVIDRKPVIYWLINPLINLFTNL